VEQQPCYYSQLEDSIETKRIKLVSNERLNWSQSLKRRQISVF